MRQLIPFIKRTGLTIEPTSVRRFQLDATRGATRDQVVCAVGRRLCLLDHSIQCGWLSEPNQAKVEPERDKRTTDLHE